MSGASRAPLHSSRLQRRSPPARATRTSWLLRAPRSSAGASSASSSPPAPSSRNAKSRCGRAPPGSSRRSTSRPTRSSQPGQVLIELERELLEAQVREARAAVESARVELRYAGIEQGRVEQLRDRDAASASAQDEARARREKAAALLAQAEARLASLDVQLGYTTVRAPLAGRVLDVFVEEGNAVSPVTAVTGGTLLLSIAGESSMHLKGLVDENEVARVRVGQPARLRTEAFAGRVFQGEVRKSRAARTTRAERHLLRGGDRRHRPRCNAAAAAHVRRRRHRDRSDRRRADRPGDGAALPRRRDLRAGGVMARTRHPRTPSCRSASSTARASRCWVVSSRANGSCSNEPFARARRRPQDLRHRACAGARAARRGSRDRARRTGRDHGAVGRRQDHVARDPGLSLDAEPGSLPARRQRRRGARRRRSRAPARRRDRLRVPELQPAAAHDRAGERRAAAGVPARAAHRTAPAR